MTKGVLDVVDAVVERTNVFGGSGGVGGGGARRPLGQDNGEPVRRMREQRRAVDRAVGRALVDVDYRRELLEASGAGSVEDFAHANYRVLWD